jgi:hypothetical protein
MVEEVKKMAENKKPDGKLFGRSHANDGMPHDLVVAVAEGVSSGVAGVIAGALVNKITKPSPPKPRKKGR